MKPIKIILSTLMVASLTVPTFASNDAGLAGEFLNFGVGARALAMGHAFTGVSDDVDAIYWNPSGLGTFRSSQVTFQHSPLILGGAYQYAAYAQPIYGFGTLGVGIINLTSGSVPKVNSLNTEIGDFEKRETGYLVSYAQRFGDMFSLGGTLKMAEHSIDDRSARGYGADLGGLYMPMERLRVGLMVRNLLTPKYKFDTDTETFPRILRAGASYKMFNDRLLTSLDLEKTIGTSQGLRPHFGLEGHIVSNVFLRAGINQTEITGGIGLNWKTLQFDYAAGFQEVGLVNRVAIKVFFGGYDVDVKAFPEVFSPVGIRNKTLLRIDSRNRNRIVNWVLSIRNGKGTVVRSFQGYSAPPPTLEWDGRNMDNQNVGPGQYSYTLTVTDNRNRSETTPVRYLRIVSPTPLEIEAK
jgi:hypothetical protein